MADRVPETQFLGRRMPNSDEKGAETLTRHVIKFFCDEFRCIPTHIEKSSKNAKTFGKKNKERKKILVLEIITHIPHDIFACDDYNPVFRSPHSTTNMYF